ncbi:DNA-processing protein DprA [Pedobacter montanisoli]|uniref:DNA-processing protein DprA n=1 Tax=Pedobacter montanisoli TaxID=2923277 RepID=A0ABS9ZX83_9SPHI|nr:DNA-processing protein DprA [Pedobacter montanisoli]MCJ0742905.1 DNA-processing protein DprA [Pedobacter montanisoli]
MDMQFKIALSMIHGVGPRLSKNLLQKFGTAQAVFDAKHHQLVQTEGVGEKTAKAILQTTALKKAEEQLNFIERHKIEVLFYADEQYPKRLRNCIDAPLILYYKGNANLNHKRVVSIVGTRNATTYGKQLCKDLLEGLREQNVLTVSGLAYGIDAIAHKESLNCDIPTVGVLGHGLDRIYPASHAELARKMAKNGGLLTEYLPGTNPDRENFPKRNRIIAGMADAIVVVEASAKGGALITAEIANSYNRDVFAYPGRTTDEYSKGCNFLIKTNRAALIHQAKDLMYYMGWERPLNPEPVQQAVLTLNLSKEEQLIVNALTEKLLSVDDLQIKLNIQQSKLAVQLLMLEMKGVIVSLPGKIYKLA